MSRFILCLLFSIAFTTSFSQRVYFVYVQADPVEPFFVKVQDRLYSSTASGYLILSKLHDSTYRFTVGFAQNKWPEMEFSVSVYGKDRGFILKDFGEKGWGLFDLQSLVVQMPVSAKTGTAASGSGSVSAFTSILSRAADDPSLKQRPVMPTEDEQKTVVKKAPVVTQEPPVKETKPIETEVVMAAPQSGSNEQTEPLVEKIAEPAKDIVQAAFSETYTPSKVTRKSESSTTEGFGLVFIDQYSNGDMDTVRLLIPNPRPAVALIKPEEKKVVNSDTSIVVVAEKPSVDAGKTATVAPVVKPAVKNNCNAVAVESDFLKLRKNMAAKKNDDDMVAEAKKYFKTKCFTTEQLKNLGALYLTDSGKYKFFVASYPYAADPANFNSLQGELKDVYYINRFSVMIRQ